LLIIPSSTGTPPGAEIDFHDDQPTERRLTIVVPNSAPEAKGHLVQLDALRALAALAVIVHHTMPDARLRWQLGIWGVKLFFVLSGYLITDILLRVREQAASVGHSRHLCLRAFYVRRLLRIFPLYYAVLFLAYLVGEPNVRDSFFWHLGYASNHLVAKLGYWPGPPLDHLWSLSVEEQFYLVWPAIVFFLPARWLRAVFTATLIIGPVARSLLFLLYRNDSTSLALLPSGLDSLGAGALLALSMKTGGSAVSRAQWCRRALFLGLVVWQVVMLLRIQDACFGLRIVLEDTAFTLMSLWLVERATEGFHGIAGRVLEWQPLVYLGTISYGLYIFHDFVPPLVFLLDHSLGRPPTFPQGGVLQCVYVTAVTIPLAALSWHFFEKPINALKTRYPYVPRSPQTTKSSSLAIVMTVPASGFSQPSSDVQARTAARVKSCPRGD
jgi:peptidoglycan/LPS O-acetylase OafA/YrhL